MNYQVFEDANVDTCILIFGRATPNQTKFRYAEVKDKLAFENVVAAEYSLEGVLSDSQTKFKPPSKASILTKFESTLDDYFDLCQGVKAYEVGKGVPAQTRKMVDEQCYSTNKMVNKQYRPFLYGSDISLFKVDWKNHEFVKFGKNLAACRDEKFHVGPRVFVQRIRNPSLKRRIVAAFSDGDEIGSAGLSILVPKPSFKGSVQAVCLYLNLPIVNEWFQGVNDDVNIKPTVLKTIPFDESFFEKGGYLHVQSKKLIDGKSLNDIEGTLLKIQNELLELKYGKKKMKRAA